MSVRLEMLQVARRAPRVLGESTELVEQFLRRQQAPDGGFYNRDGRSDLYYTVFGLEGLQALEAGLPTDQVRPYLEELGQGESLDFIHLCCLARCWAALGEGPGLANPKAFCHRLEQYRSRDGGYHPQSPGAKNGTAYGAFLALGAYEDVGEDLPDPRGVVQSLKHIETSDAAWANTPHSSEGATNPTAAAVTLLRLLQMPVNASVGDWLLARHHPKGGFVAAPNVPMPDLLSTATALHALAGLEVPIQSIQEPSLDFIDTLWTNEGGFYAHWADDTLDCEYAYYGLLALGHLSFA